MKNTTHEGYIENPEPVFSWLDQFLEPNLNKKSSGGYSFKCKNKSYKLFRNQGYSWYSKESNTWRDDANVNIGFKDLNIHQVKKSLCN